MNYDEILVKLRERLLELEDERSHINAILAPPSSGIERANDVPRKKAVWTTARRKKQAQLMRQLHRKGKI